MHRPADSDEEASMNIWAALGITLGVLAVYMTAGWLLSLARKDASVVDPLWGTGFVVAAVSYLMLLDGHRARQVLALVMVAVWGLRLSIYLLWRNRGRGEDPRYTAMRNKRPGSFWWYSYLQVFLLQALLLWLVAAPIAGAMDAPGSGAVAGQSGGSLVALDYVGLAVWLFGLAWEVAGDTQLALFKRNPANKGKVMQTGVWRYTRHPNYFGEVVLWWGVWLVAAAAHGYWSAYGPVLITLLLLRVSGVTLLEKGLKESKPGYAEYVARTSPFIPWPPKRESGTGRSEGSAS
jgi:steroid 5-alpha reductase family enzyme